MSWYISKPRGYRAARVNLKVNYGLWMIIMCQCSFIIVTNVPSVGEDVNNGKTMHVWGQRVEGKSLSLPLNFSVNLKLL